MTHQDVADILPPAARACLVRAAAKARALPADSLPRAAVIRDAVRKVKHEYPRYFRDAQ